MGLYSDEADWVAGQLFANVAMYFVAFLTLNTDTDTDTAGVSTQKWGQYEGVLSTISAR